MFIVAAEGQETVNTAGQPTAEVAGEQAQNTGPANRSSG